MLSARAVFEFASFSTRIPFLVSWPARLARDRRRAELVCLTDLFGIATTAAGEPELREGRDVLGMVAGAAVPRAVVVGCYGLPGTDAFKVMVRLRRTGRRRLQGAALPQVAVARREDLSVRPLKRNHRLPGESGGRTVPHSASLTVCCARGCGQPAARR